MQALLRLRCTSSSCCGARALIVPDESAVTKLIEVRKAGEVAAEQSLITVEGDKASMEVPAPFVGTVKEIKISTGDKSLHRLRSWSSEVEALACHRCRGAPAPAAAPAQAAKPLHLLQSRRQI
jgi:pyruvate dehydrogenase E2 component (dihydrolipoamide acetyltransferase)